MLETQLIGEVSRYSTVRQAIRHIKEVAFAYAEVCHRWRRESLLTEARMCELPFQSIPERLEFIARMERRKVKMDLPQTIGMVLEIEKLLPPPVKGAAMAFPAQRQPKYRCFCCGDGGHLRRTAR